MPIAVPWCSAGAQRDASGSAAANEDAETPRKPLSTSLLPGWVGDDDRSMMVAFTLRRRGCPAMINGESALACDRPRSRRPSGRGRRYLDVEQEGVSKVGVAGLKEGFVHEVVLLNATRRFR